MPAHSASRARLNALMSRASTSSRFVQQSKTWMPETNPATTERTQGERIYRPGKTAHSLCQQYAREGSMRGPIAAIVLLIAAWLAAAPARAADYVPDPALVAAARKEGEVT